MALGKTVEEAEEQFHNLWSKCISSIYPMEIQVLKETCRNRFDDFIKNLSNSSAKTHDQMHKSQAIKLIQLLKGCPNYRSIIEPPIVPEEESSDEESLLGIHEKDHRLYQQITNKIESFENCIKLAPRVQSQFLSLLIHGNIYTLDELIKKFEISSQDVLQMRGLEFSVPLTIKETKLALFQKIEIDAYNWNPLHYVVVYKRFRALNYLKKVFGKKFDFIWAMRLSSNKHYEGIPSPPGNLGKKDLAQYHNDKFEHLYGLVLALMTKST